MNAATNQPSLLKLRLGQSNQAGHSNVPHLVKDQLLRDGKLGCAVGDEQSSKEQAQSTS